MSQPCFVPADILLPAMGTPLDPWACIAVDQFTSQPEYWQQAEALAAGNQRFFHFCAAAFSFLASCKSCSAIMAQSSS